MSRLGIISDIHGNLHALQAVLSYLGKASIDELICLGDIVGYGPAPDVCLDLVVKHCSVIVRGNHDEAVVDPRRADEFNGAARDAVFWTREVLGPLHLNALNRLKPIEHVSDEVLCVHDSPADGPTDYVHDQHVARWAFRGVDRPICLLGHTHVPMLFEAPGTDPETDLAISDIVAHLPQDGVSISFETECRYICNPGSVGQPRDCDPRASFAILDLQERTFTVHRCEYDIAGAQAASAAAGLPVVLADRLSIGA
jgi:predicted phosphodiesterase